MINITNLEDQLNNQGFIVSNISGTSMYPFLKPNKHRVIISKVNINDINKYDVVLYKSNNKYILHRVIDIKDDILLIRGDNTLNIEYINIQDIIAKLVSYYDHNKCIDVSDKMNMKYYNKSIKTLKYRTIKQELKNKIKKIIGYNN